MTDPRTPLSRTRLLEAARKRGRKAGDRQLRGTSCKPRGMRPDMQEFAERRREDKPQEAEKLGEERGSNARHY